MPQELDQMALREMKEVILPAAKPHLEIVDKYDPTTGVLTPGRRVEGRTIAGTLPHREIPHREVPRTVSLPPRKPYKTMFLPVDGHGNKEWVWVANEAKSRRCDDAKALEAAIKDGYQKKHYVAPPPPVEDPEEEAIAK